MLEHSIASEATLHLPSVASLFMYRVGDACDLSEVDGEQIVMLCIECAMGCSRYRTAGSDRLTDA